MIDKHDSTLRGRVTIYTDTGNPYASFIARFRVFEARSFTSFTL